MFNKTITIIYLFIISILLIGCNAEKTHASIPIQTAQKAILPHKTYHVWGKKYHIMPTSDNYEEKGIASWYGRPFHHRSTSSGERYNMYKLTAAHKTLPLPTYVKVTNLHNGRSVVVKVNDRGPFISNRLIDLSYAAAKKLGMLGHGLARVTVKALPEIQA